MKDKAHAFIMERMKIWAIFPITSHTRPQPNLQTLGYGKGSVIVHALSVASAGSMGSQSQFPRDIYPEIEKMRRNHNQVLFDHLMDCVNSCSLWTMIGFGLAMAFF
ncbi:hypothetical protein ACOSP7_028938 [Xanthoceras sorbifolium]